MTPHKHAPHSRVGHSAQHLYPVMQLALLPRFLQEQSFRPVTADDEMQVGVALAHDLGRGVGVGVGGGAINSSASMLR